MFVEFFFGNQSSHRKKKDIEIKKDIFYVDIENKSHRIN